MAPDNDDNDFLTGRVPEPDAEPTAAERAHAKTFADLIDKTLSGHTPPAMSTDDRTLLEVATVIRAASGNALLDAAKQRSLVEDALRQAIGGAGSSAATTGSVVPITRSRARRWAPWAVAATSTLVAAAVLILWVRTPPRIVTHTVPAAQNLPETWKSRPADALIGPITKEHAGDASARIDTIFADRLDGYRELRLRGRKP
jgi:hypothetical protein